MQFLHSPHQRGLKNEGEVEVLAAMFHSSDAEHGAVEPGGFDSYNKEEHQNNPIKRWVSVFT